MNATAAPVGRLIVCPTPIGNLQDITLRALRELSEADLIACEDTRHTKVLLDRHAIEGPRLVSFHEHNEDARAPALARRIAGGEVVALVSDAGMPVVSDPGYALVRACLDAGVTVEVLPGPSAVPTALVASGLAPESWRFVGFLPRARAAADALFDNAVETLVAFESPRRLAATLERIAARDPERSVVVCRELTKVHEEVRRGSAGELAAHYRAHQPRGEIVLLCAPAPPGEPQRERALAALRALREAGARPRPAAAVVAELTGVSANELYRELVRSGQ
ncbi:MAG TPA: 16S rRNA (cytidine(1402)-2'-O)-methyltransferase [Solirubrobacteraceae bacterium]|jgi:16S rRNA (cytidine1402-2'-O)-methyltransferase|nr:16S rRNA (cytidine(1402)-2'-O)-methyltransferase [Solirubrobacteraceae bacterium]